MKEPFTPPDARDPEVIQPWFLLATGLLLMIIIAALTGLMLGMHRRAQTAERQLDILEAQLQRSDEIIRIFGENPLLMAAPAIGRDRLPARSATLDGQPVTLLHLDHDTADLLGLLPGDLLLVDQPSPQLDQ